MADEEVVETFYGRHNKFEVVKIKRPLQGTKFYIKKDGKAHRGAFSSLSDAVRAAKEDL